MVSDIADKVTFEQKLEGNKRKNSPGRENVQRSQGSFVPCLRYAGTAGAK